jgi:mRNA interferase RelE/StbE
VSDGDLPPYRIEYTKTALKDLKKVARADLERIVAKIESLADEPRPQGVQKLVGADDLYRIRLGDYRIIYSIDDSSRRVTIARVRQRGGAYDNL